MVAMIDELPVSIRGRSCVSRPRLAKLPIKTSALILCHSDSGLSHILFALSRISFDRRCRVRRFSALQSKFEDRLQTTTKLVATTITPLAAIAQLRRLRALFSRCVRISLLTTLFVYM